MRTPHVPTSCFVGEWEEWSACNATCWETNRTPQRSRRRSSLTTSTMTADPNCVLEEQQDCGDLLKPCAGYCWTAQWTEWSECVSVLYEEEIVTARRRYKPVFAGEEYCDLDSLQETSLCSESMFIHAASAPSSSCSFKILNK